MVPSKLEMNYLKDSFYDHLIKILLKLNLLPLCCNFPGFRSKFLVDHLSRNVVASFTPCGPSVSVGIGRIIDIRIIKRTSDRF